MEANRAIHHVLGKLVRQKDGVKAALTASRMSVADAHEARCDQRLAGAHNRFSARRVSSGFKAIGFSHSRSLWAIRNRQLAIQK